MNRPRIGLVLLRAQWFREVVRFPRLDRLMAEDALAIRAMLAAEADVAVFPVESVADSHRAAAALRASPPDLTIISFQVWAEDRLLLPVIEAVRSDPLVMWCFRPSIRVPDWLPFDELLRASGLVGTLEGLGTLNRVRPDFLWVAGAADDPKVRERLVTFARASAVCATLRRTRIGLLPGHNDQMLSTYVDEARLFRKLGPEVVSMSARQLAEAATRVPDEMVVEFASVLRRKVTAVAVDEQTLFRACRASLALGAVALQADVQVLAFNDIDAEVHALLGLRPCFFPPQLREPGRLIGLEGDLGCATAMAILRILAGGPVLFVELFTWDDEANVFLAGHAGALDEEAANRSYPLQITPDFEYRNSDPAEGAWLSFVARPGRATLLQLREDGDGFRMTCMPGEVLDSPPRIEGYPHLVVRPDAPVGRILQHFAQAGSTQHFAVAYGDLASPISALGAMVKAQVDLLVAAGGPSNPHE
jgi:L-arabinose isomerase